MPQQKEKLPQDTIDFLRNTQTELGQYVFQIGEIALKERELKSDLEKLENLKKETEQKFDLLSLKLENSVQDLQRKYPNGDINLEEGTITYEA